MNTKLNDPLEVRKNIFDHLSGTFPLLRSAFNLKGLEIMLLTNESTNLLSLRRLYTLDKDIT